MSARVAFLERAVAPEEERPRTAVNSSAVADRGGRTVVFVVKDDRTVETPVSLGGKLGETVEVISGVKAGERIVLNPSKKVKDGSKVTRKEQ
jgi:hypothetical protein